MPPVTRVIFFVTADEYPALQASDPENFPYTYEEFAQRVEDCIRNLPKDDIVIKIHADVADFLAWCAESKIVPNNKARCEYALYVYTQGYTSGAHA